MSKFIRKIIPKPGIQGKLTLIFILLSTLPLILVSIFTVKQQINFKQDENVREMESDIKGLRERTSLFLTRVESEILLVMKSTELKKLLSNLKNNSKIDDKLQQNTEKEFINIVTDNTFYVKIDLLNNRGKEVLSVINDTEKPYAVNRDSLSKSSKNYYVQIARNLKPGEIDLSPSEIRIPNTNTFAPVIDFILPIYDEKEKVSAIVTTKLQAEKLFELLVPSYGSSPKKISIVNGEGYYIFNSERKNNWNSLFTAKNDENLSKDYSDEIAFKILLGKTSTTLYHQDRIIQYSPIFSGSKAKTDRYFIIEDADAEEVMASIDNLKILLIVLILVVTFVSLAVGYLTARQFLKPIKQLIKGTQIIRSGNLDYKLEIATHDEIQDLITNFNQLVVEWKQKQLLEKEVRKSEKLFSSLAQTATDAILETDDKGIAMVWNDAATRIFGFKKEEVLGKNALSLIVPPKYRGIAEKQLSDFLMPDLDDPNGRTVEITALRKDGSEFPAELSISSVSLDDTRYATGIIRDITQRKRMVEEIIEAKEKAEVAYKLKTEFLNQMSHEIRTPLNIILNFSDYIYFDLKEKGLLSDDITQNLKEIKESGDRIIRTVELILCMSEIQTGSYENKPRKTDIYTDVLMKSFSKYQLAAREKGLQLNLDRNTRNSIFNVDPDSVEQVFNHLIDNAIKFTSTGTITIIIDEDEKNNIIVSIKDTGIGISKEYLPKLFEPFSQEQHGLSRSYEGNGLGLALVKKICEMNNVTIEVSSTKGEGSEVKLTFLHDSVLVKPENSLPMY